MQPRDYADLLYQDPQPQYYSSNRAGPTPQLPIGDPARLQQYPRLNDEPAPAQFYFPKMEIPQAPPSAVLLLVIVLFVCTVYLFVKHSSLAARYEQLAMMLITRRPIMMSETTTTVNQPAYRAATPVEEPLPNPAPLPIPSAPQTSF